VERGRLEAADERIGWGACVIGTMAAKRGNCAGKSDTKVKSHGPVGDEAMAVDIG